MSAECSFLIPDESPRRFLAHNFNPYWFTHCKKCFFYSLICHCVSNTVTLCLKMQHLLRWWGLLICWHLSMDLFKVFDLARVRLEISNCLCFSGENDSQYTCKILYVVRTCQILCYNNLLCIKCSSGLGGGEEHTMSLTGLWYFLFERKFVSAVVTKHGGFATDSSWGKCYFCLFGLFFFFPFLFFCLCNVI